MTLDEIIAQLDDTPEQHLQCADALLSEGEPQGQVMALQARGLRDPPAERALEATVRSVLGTSEGEDEPTFDLEWRWGFLSAIRWGGWHDFEPISENYEALCELTQSSIELVPSLPWSASITVNDRIRAHRLLARLRTVHVGPWSVRPSYDPLWQLIGRIGLPPSVRELIIADVPHAHRDEHQITWVDLGAMSQAMPAIRQLERIDIRGSYLRLGQIDLPKLKSFSLLSSTFDELGAVRSAKWPKLESLSIGFGDDEYNPAPCTFDDVAAFLREVPIGVKHLGLRNLPFTDELIAPLASSDVLKRLTSLDLSLGVLLDRGAELFARHADAFAHLTTIDVTDTGLTDFDALKLRVPGLRREKEWRTKIERYVSISE